MKVYSHFLAIFITAALFLLVVSLGGTAMLLRPGEIKYTQVGEAVEASWTRGTPLGGLWVEWSTECVGTDGVERGADGKRFYQETRDPVRYQIGGDILACFQGDGPVEFRHRWQHDLFGILPLRPVTRQYTTNLRQQPGG